MKNIRRKFISFILMSVLLFTAAACSREAPPASEDSVAAEPLDITLLDVGKADCNIFSIGGSYVMIDTGHEKTSDDVLDALKEQGIEKLDYLIITHFDKDHVGGADHVIEELEVAHVVQPDYVPDHKQYRQYLKALEEKEIEPEHLTKKETFSISDARFTMYPPEKSDYEEGDNDFSIVVSVAHGGSRLLFAGDAEEERLNEVIAMGDLKHQFLKVPHHGQPEDNSAQFFSLVNPEYAVITCDEDDPASDTVVDLLEKQGCQVFETVDGTVTCHSDGKSLQVTQK